MMKSKFIRLSLPISLDELSKKMSSKIFNNTSMSGFELISIHRNTLHARFIEKITFKQTLIDPFGVESIYEGVTYNVVEFEICHLFDELCVLKLISPPRSINTFRSELYKLCGFGLTFSDTSIDIILFLNKLKLRLNPHPIKITKIKAKGIRLGTDSSASIEIVSSKDALEDLQSTYESDLVTVTKAKIQIRSVKMTGNIEISQTGLILYEEDVQELVENLMQGLLTDSRDDI